MTKILNAKQKNSAIKYGESCQNIQRKKIEVSINNRIVMVGTEDELGQRSTLSPVTIRNLARNNGTDRFGKSYRYLEV